MIAAIIAAVASLFVAGFSAWLKQRSDRALEGFKADSAEALETFKSDLAGIQAERGARLSYEYEARKHLYAEFYPLLFQLVEACESAYNRVGGIALAAQKQLLRGFVDDYEYLLQIVYRLFCPLAVFRLCQSKLTSVDLTVDPWVRAQYLTAKQLYATWISAAELAEAEPSIHYQPISPNFGPRNGGAVDPWQHLSVGRVEQLIEALQVRDDKGPSRCKSYGEFRAWAADLDRKDHQPDQSAPLRDSVALAMELFKDFHPSTRPVLWRALLAEACLSKLLIRAFEDHQAGDGSTRPQPTEDLLFTAKDRDELDWTREDTPTEQKVQAAGSFDAVLNYLADRLTPYGLYPSQTTEAPGDNSTGSSSRH
jgi:hypothetical protein